MPHHRTLTDEELLAQYRHTGEAEWLGRLLERHTVLLLGVALKYMKDKDAAHDAVSAVFLKALTHLPSGPIANLKGWLYILTRNHCLQHLRDRRHTAGDEALQHVADAGEAAREDHLLKNTTLDELHAALGELGHEQRTCVTLFYLEKKSYAQITETTGYSFAQVKSFIQNGKRNLRIHLLGRLGHRLYP